MVLVNVNKVHCSSRLENNENVALCNYVYYVATSAGRHIVV